MSFKKFALVTLVAASAFAASPAYASYAGFHFLFNQDGNHNNGDTNNHNSDNHNSDNQNSDSHNNDPCQGWSCESDNPPSRNPHWDDQDGNTGFPMGHDGPQDTPVSGVPEPATWAMFLLGFGSIGFMLRGARRKQAGSAA